MPDMGKRFSHHTNRENPLTRPIPTLHHRNIQKENPPLNHFNEGLNLLPYEPKTFIRQAC